MKAIIEAMPLEDFERMEKGLPPRPKKQVVIPEPEPPVVDNQIYFKNFPANKEIIKIEGRRRSVKNKDGMTFIGYDLVVIFRDESSISGWAPEEDFQKIRRAARAGNIDTGADKIL
jgi:hypothetical protein